MWDTRALATSTSFSSTVALSRTFAAALDSRITVSSVRTCAPLSLRGSLARPGFAQRKGLPSA